MKIIDDIKLSCEENLAMDELFLLGAEKGETGETLRFWESEEYFVVIGRSGKAEEECFLSNCRQDRVKVLRRLSGGGTVLQGKGCLNYSAVLSYSRDERYRNIGFSYENIMKGLALGFSSKGLAAEFLPMSDLALGGKKFSGNAQARKRNYFLHHGTILFGMDISRVERYLKHPPKEPDYRTARGHNDFLLNIKLSSDEIKDVIKAVFTRGEKTITTGKADTKGLKNIVKEKYSLDSWNLCF